MSRQITIEKLGEATKTTVVEDGKIISKYGGAILDQNHNQFTVQFRDRSVMVISFSDVTDTFGAVNAEELTDYLSRNGFLLTPS